MTTDLVHFHDQHATTTSLIVAEKFGKRHDHVLRSIEKLISDCRDLASTDPNFGGSKGFAEPNFGLSTYLDPTGRNLPMYEITRDGFSLLVMGFTGKEALAWKLKFIAAFNALEAEVLDRLKTNVKWERDHIEQAKAYWFERRKHWRPIYDLLMQSEEPKAIAERIGKSVSAVRRAIHRMIKVGILHPRLVREAIRKSAFARQLARSGVIDAWGGKAKQLDLFALEAR
jgi:Rha family phage regulatory protein